MLGDMVLILVFVILQICHMIQSREVADCENLPPLTYCPHVKSSVWNKRATCMNCSSGTEYHCCKDYESPESPPGCPQDDYDCVREIFVEGCAQVKYCSKGTEPVLSFYLNQQKTNRPTVYCVDCKNRNRYNDFPNTSSAEFVECFEKHNICTQERHKIECNESDSTAERYCRCDARNGYTPYSHPLDHPPSGCSFDNYECQKTRECPKDQEVLLNYTCGKRCKTGFYRPSYSDDCIPIDTTVRTTRLKEVTKSTAEVTKSTDVTPLKNRTAKVTLPDLSTKRTATMAPPADNSEKLNPAKIIIGIIVGVVVVVVLLINLPTVVLVCNARRCGQSAPVEGKKKNGPLQESPLPQNVDGAQPIPLEIREDGDNRNGQNIGQNEAPLAQAERDPFMEEDGDNRNGQNEPPQAQAERDPLMEEDGDDDEENLNRFRSNERDAERDPLMEEDGDNRNGQNEPPQAQAERDPLMEEDGDDDEENLNRFRSNERDEIIHKSLARSRPYFVKHLESERVLDFMAVVLEFEEIRSLREQTDTSERTRNLLDKVNQKGPDCYISFKKALKKSGQKRLLEHLLKHEKDVCQEIEDWNETNEESAC